MAKSPSKYGEYGKTGLPVYSGRIYDETDRKLTGDQWRKVVREMIDSDGSIGALLFAIEMIVRQVTWEVKPYEPLPEDEDLALFVRQCLFEDMQQTWPDMVAEILSFLPWGWSWFEIVYKRRSGNRKSKTGTSRFSDGRIGWRKWAIRAQESLSEWKFDEWDEVEALVQQPEPDNDIRTIPFAKSLHFRTSSHKQNPEGRPILRRAYRAYYFKRHIENIEGIGIERDLAGMPKIGAPPEIFKADASPDEKAMLEHLKNLGGQIRQNESAYVLYPLEYNDKGHKLFDVELLSTGGRRQFDTSGIIDRYDQRMLMSVMADFLLLGSKEVGSYALSDTKFRAFLKALKTWVDTISETVNRHAIPRLLELNGISSERAPYLEAGTLEDVSLEALGTFVEVLTKAGVTFTPEEQEYLKGRAQIPVDAKPEGDDPDADLPAPTPESEDDTDDTAPVKKESNSEDEE